MSVQQSLRRSSESASELRAARGTLAFCEAKSTNAEPGDPDVKKELKPRACALGGELIAVISSTGLHNRYGRPLEGRQISFQVLAKKQPQDTAY